MPSDPKDTECTQHSDVGSSGKRAISGNDSCAMKWSSGIKFYIELLKTRSNLLKLSRKFRKVSLGFGCVPHVTLDWTNYMLFSFLDLVHVSVSSQIPSRLRPFNSY